MVVVSTWFHVICLLLCLIYVQCVVELIPVRLNWQCTQGARQNIQKNNLHNNLSATTKNFEVSFIYVLVFCRWSGSNWMDCIDASPHRQVRLRRASPARWLVICRLATAIVGLIRPPYSAICELTTMDGHWGKPRDWGINIPRHEVFYCIQPQVDQPFIVLNFLHNKLMMMSTTTQL
jgi:hypothetical protein